MANPRRLLLLRPLAARLGQTVDYFWRAGPLACTRDQQHSSTHATHSNETRRLATMASSRMQSWFPHTAHPLVISAPMDFVTNPKLATEVTKAGGLGFLQGGRDFASESPVLGRLEAQLAQARSLLGLPANDGDLPVGVGFVLYAASARHFGATAAPILRRHRPAAVWLFAPAPDAPGTVPGAIRALKGKGGEGAAAAWRPRVAVQVGSVAAALAAARHGADVVVAQAADAGGHQFVGGAGLVSLVPEVADALARSGFAGVAVWAAGGIVDGRGVAAALTLGAEGAVLGTRYMVATESDAQDYKKEAVLATSDGGVNTVKSPLHDHILGNKSWPDAYDGRAIVSASWRDHLAGLPVEENVARFEAAKETGDFSRMITWSIPQLTSDRRPPLKSGTGVGLVREALPAAEITRQVREGALEAIGRLKASI
ncbi:FMN-dependent 2-nitropropane dioxygenase [Durotheca rogersii]|uniref:FMN-dependent 2-nitropropane dioxygenase n=1 Tax=Durotheca rogersii TaxID=419775 RepID=UPI0022200072|nr:FMN-dependent 2-nitropropane dioxygenase [Durotheca rogersii]KAI5860596.1 FMN-dependent 2-nitropropane dioxygenase [Durotheca rogersii]